jgi:transcriptional regulator with XRE-family HTH domain
MTYISSNIRHLRKLSGLSQQDFAQRVGLNRGNVASYEKGSAEPGSEKLIRISRFFHVDLADFIERDLSEMVAGVDARTHHVRLEKETLDELLRDFSAHQEETTSLQILAERSLRLRKIVEGIRQYYEPEPGVQVPTASDLPALQVDFERLVRISSEVLDTNRQLLRMLLEQKQ